MVIIGILFVIPYVMAAFAAFKAPREIFSEKPWTPPHHPTLDNFNQLVTEYDFLRFMLNSAITSLAFAFGQVTTSVLAGYAFARLRFPFQKSIFWAFIVTMTVPEIVTIIPRYIEVSHFGWINTYQGIVGPYFLATSFGVFLVRQYMMTIPDEFFDAAKVDGAGTYMILRRIVVPVSRPVIATLGILTFVFAWNNFLWPLVVTNDTRHQVLTVGIAEFHQVVGQLQWNLLMAGAVFSLAPLILVFFVLQRYIISSIQLASR
jgi:multiple sugar transport system permease protein